MLGELLQSGSVAKIPLKANVRLVFIAFISLLINFSIFVFNSKHIGKFVDQ